MKAKILALAQSTETNSLCKAWGLSRSAVLARKKGERPLTVREVGALVDLLNMELSSLLSAS